ncbi:MAG: PAS domain S-box protein [Anaerolineae bacterium]|nr:PAS domain S-box protein [Anaerolineae bacterium]
MSIYLTPAAISYLTQSILALAITGYLLRRARLVPSRNRQPHLYLLIGFLTTITGFSLLLFAETSLPRGYDFYAILPQTTVVGIGLVLLLQFAYRFPALSPRHKWEARAVLILSAAYTLWEFLFTLHRFRLLCLGQAIYRPDYADFPLALAFLWVPLVFLRQTIRISVENAGGRASLPLRYIWRPLGRDARATRALGLVYLIPFVLSLSNLLAAYYLVSRSYYHVSLSWGILVALVAFAVIYLDYRSETTSFVVKLVGITLMVLLAALGTVGWVISPRYAASYRPVLPDQQTLRFTPNVRGGYDVTRQPLDFENDIGDHLEMAEDVDRWSIRLNSAFSFPFYGHLYEELYVSGDGVISLGENIRYSFLNYHYGGGRPVIIPLFFDLRPESGPGGVFVRQDEERLILTWYQVPSFYNAEAIFTFQVILYRSGVFDITYKELSDRLVYLSNQDAGLTPWLIGAVPGRLDTWPALTDFSASSVQGDARGLIQDYQLEFRSYLHHFLIPLAYLILGVSLLVIVGFPALLYTSLVKPLNALLEGGRHLNAGHYDVHLPVQYPDEIGFLTQSFNDLSVRLDTLIDGLEARVTERTQALRESERELRTITNNIPLYISAVDAELRYRFVNQKYVEVFGLNADEIIGRHVKDVLGKAYYDRTAPMMEAALAGQEVSFESTIELPHQGTRWLNVNYVPEAAAPGQRGGVYILTQDITERKQAEEAIRRSEEHFRLLFETNPFPLLITRAADGGIVRANQALIDYMEGSEADLTSTRAPDYYAFSTDRRTLLDEVKTKGRVVNKVVELKTAQGRTKFALVNVLPLDFSGEPCLLVGMADITEREQVEKELRSLTDRFELYLKYIPIPMYIKDADTRAVILSRHFEQMLGKPVSELLGKTNEEIWSPELAGPMTLDDQRVMREGLVVSADESFAGHYYHSLKFPIKEPGQPPMLGGYTIDITELKRGEQVQAALYRISEAAQSVQNLNELFPAIHAVVGELMSAKNFYIALYDEADGLIRFVYHVDEHDPTPPPYRPNKGLTAYVLRTGKPLLASPEGYQHLIDSGEVEITGAPAVDWIGIPLKTIDRKTIGVMAAQTYDPGLRYSEENKNLLLFVSTQVAMAIERKQAEEARRESEARMRQITAAMRQAVWLWDTQTLQVLYVNPAYEEIWGQTCESLIVNSISFIQAVHPEDKDRVLEAVREQTQGVPFDREYRILRPDGSIRWVWGRTFSIENDAGQIYRVLAVVEDITERKQMEESLRQSKEAAEMANRAKSAFLSNMSHELRTPLTAILGFAEVMLHDELLADRQRENVEIIHRSGEHLLALINDVLDLSKIEAGRVEVQPEVFDLHEMLLGLGEMFSLRAEQKGLTVVFDLAPEVPQHVYADMSKLRQVLINLLGNAVKFTERGSIILKLKSRQGNEGSVDKEDQISVPLSTLYFEIQDTGVGIASDELEKLFGAFIQTESGRQSGQGTGLGLAISRQYVRLMGGDITVESMVGKGSCFRFDIQVELPTAAACEALTAAASRHVLGLEPGQQASDGGPFRLLVVEDNESARDVLVRLLRPLGFEVHEAADGQEAVAIWESWRPHLIWMDIRMPVLDGYEATRRIKAAPQGQQTVIVALSASAFDQERAEILAAGCDDFLRKPFREAQIVDVLTRQLGVRFLYENGPAIKSRPLDPVLLQGAPDGWRSAMRQALMIGDVVQMSALVDQLPGPQELLDDLRKKVYQFDHEAILKWME